MRRWFATAILGLLSVLAFSVARPVYAADGEPLRLYFLDVGQGDAALLVSPDGVTALVDGGDSPAGPGLVATLRSLGIDHVDWIMPSHPHVDHIGGLNTVLEQMEVANALVSNQSHTTAAYRRQMQLIESKHVALVPAEEGLVIQLGEQVTATVLNPPVGLLPTVEPIEDNSVVLRVCIVANCILFTGDIGDQGERLLFARYSDRPDAIQSKILKVSHHGSAEPNWPPLLDLIKPELALIGVGEGNPFHHPTQRALDRLAGAGATVHRTDQDGMILVEINADGYTVDASRGSASPAVAPPFAPFFDRDCGDFKNWDEAQAFYAAAGGPAQDPHRLDADRDGVACESLLGSPTSTVIPIPTFNPSLYLGQGDRYNCGDFTSQADAQAVLRADPADPNRLDPDRDGIACASNRAPRDTTPVPR